MIFSWRSDSFKNVMIHLFLVVFEHTPNRDWMADIPRGTKADFRDDILCPGPDFQTNVPTNSIDDVLLETCKLLDILYMPWVEIDFLVEVSCRGADITVTEDSTSSLQSNALGE